MCTMSYHSMCDDRNFGFGGHKLKNLKVKINASHVDWYLLN